MPDEIKRDLLLAGAITGGVALLLAPSAVITLGLGVALGYKGEAVIKHILRQKQGG